MKYRGWNILISSNTYRYFKTQRNRTFIDGVLHVYHVRRTRKNQNAIHFGDSPDYLSVCSFFRVSFSVRRTEHLQETIYLISMLRNSKYEIYATNNQI